ncbi:Protein of unknown function [Singulisphaera sp. GP187]|nr:Protein of unknown function [Singulisphaera sp. GP187]
MPRQRPGWLGLARNGDAERPLSDLAYKKGIGPMRRVPILMAAWALFAAHSVVAQSWVDTVFPERAFDFGNVARGSKIHHTFRLINRTGYEIHIADWRTKCGCTEVKVGARVIPTGTQTSIEAVIDTTKFVGHKASGLTLIIDQPNFVEVDLNLSCFIRGDITLMPGQVDFGTVQRSATPKINLQLNYAGGMPNWQVTKMKTQSNHIKAELKPAGSTIDGQQQFTLIATLHPTVPNGYFKDEITLETNDPSGATIPVSVTANVQTAVVVSPSIINLGRVKPGSTVTKKVLVRSAQPFNLTTLKGNKEELSGKADPEGARPLHTVDITFKAPDQAGPYNAVFEIATDLKDEPPATLRTFATIAP